MRPERTGELRHVLSKFALLSLLAGAFAPMEAAYAQTCGNLLTNEFNGSFGAIPLPGPPDRRNLQNPQVPNAAGYVYQFGDPVSQGDYLVTSRNFVNGTFPGTNHWENIVGHNAGGPVNFDDAFLTVNGLTIAGQTFYSQDLVLVGGQSYTITVWAANAVVDPTPSSLPQVGVRVRNLTTNAIVPGASTSTIILPSRPNNTVTQWFPATITFVVPGDALYRYELFNASNASSGNDFVIDDMGIAPTTEAGCPVDFGDAPDTGAGTGAGNYQTLLSDNGPRHRLVGGLFLGGSATEETDALQNASASGDVDNGIGAIPAITTNPGSVVDIPITALNLSGTGASAAGFIDFNGDGDFLDAGERSTIVSVPNNSTTSTPQSFSLRFTVPATGTIVGNSVLRVRLANDAAEISSAVGAARSGEVEDAQVRITLGATATLQLAKAWGANSVAGNQVTIGATTGGANNTAAFNATAPTAANSGAAVVVVVGNVITLPAETGTNLASYTTAVACTGGHTLSGTDGQQTNTLTITSVNPAVCTYTNTPRTATLTLRKQWSGATVGDDATITVSRGATIIDTFDSDAGTAGELDTDATPTAVVIGETVTLAETLTAANAGLYDTALACTGAADANPADGLTIGAADTAIVCTYTNTRRSADLSITKTNTPAAGALDQANDTVDAAQATTYTLVVTNDGTTAVTGAVVRDTPGADITCPPGNAVTISGDGVPAGSFTVADLTGANGIVLGTLAAGQSTTLSFTCQVN